MSDKKAINKIQVQEIIHLENDINKMTIIIVSQECKQEMNIMIMVKNYCTRDAVKGGLCEWMNEWMNVEVNEIPVMENLSIQH